MTDFVTLATFTYLREQVLPRLIETAQATGAELRFWSAGATGEEAPTRWRF